MNILQNPKLKTDPDMTEYQGAACEAYTKLN